MGGILSALSDAVADALAGLASLLSKRPTKPVDLTVAQKSQQKSIEELVTDARKKLSMDVTKQINFAVVGQGGAGKSTLINAFRQMKDTDPGAAPVGETETTTRIQKYPHPTYTHLVLWDIPGAGTLRQPEATYFEDNMLYAFDCILVLTADRFLKVDFEILKKAREFKRPCAFVRSKADASVKAIAVREEKKMLDASKDLRRKVDESFQKGLQDSGVSSDTFYQLFIASAWAFRKKNAYALYDAETGELDKSLAMMDEDQLAVFLTNSVWSRLGRRG